MPSKGLGVDEKGHPIAGFKIYLSTLKLDRMSEVATLGFKRLYMNRSHAPEKSQISSKPRTRLIVQPYSERKAKRLRFLVFMKFSHIC